jgi:hypothetical protein
VRREGEEDGSGNEFTELASSGNRGTEIGKLHLVMI